MAQNTMVKESLSQSMVAEGASLVRKLDEAKWDVTAALWFHLADDNGWKLLIASPEVESKGPRESYATIQKVLGELDPSPTEVSLNDIGLMASNHPLVGLLSSAIATGKSISNIRFSKNVIGGHFIDDALIYRMGSHAAACRRRISEYALRAQLAAALQQSTIASARQFVTSAPIMKAIRLGVLLLPLVPLRVHAQSALSAMAPGCYQVDVGPWSGSFPSGMPTGHQPPAVIRLDTTEISGRRTQSGNRRVIPGIPDLERYRVVRPYWRTNAGDDTLTISWSSGFVGIRLVLAQSSSGFAGTAQAFHDVIGPVQPHAAVTLTRRSCPDSLGGASAP